MKYKNAVHESLANVRKRKRSLNRNLNAYKKTRNPEFREYLTKEKNFISGQLKLERSILFFERKKVVIDFFNNIFSDLFRKLQGRAD